MPASTEQQSRPSEPREMISRYRLPAVKRVSLHNAGKKKWGSGSNVKVKINSHPDHQKYKADELIKKAMDERISKMTRFGPAYGDDTEANQNAKDSAWKRVVVDKGAEVSYMKSIAEIEKEVIKCYDKKLMLKPGSEFRMAMARDGCFFLHLALHILGGKQLLKHHPENPYFGINIDNTSRIPDLFFVGNQVPYIVITALMKQPFFQAVIKKGIEKGTWKRPVDGDLARLALYLMVVEPHLEKQKKQIISLPRKQPLPCFRNDPPSHALQALHRLLLGSRRDNDPVYSEMKEFVDLELGNKGKDKMAIASAGDLEKQGIQLVKGELGITNIRFKNWGFSAYLHVPPFTIDAHTEHLLASLANHELSLNESERELTAYLRFMRDLSRTYKDFKILERKGIIIVKDEELKPTMLYMLDTLVSHHSSTYTLNFRQIRREINDYGGPPWRLISFTLGVLAVVQTIFTVLSYCSPIR